MLWGIPERNRVARDKTEKFSSAFYKRRRGGGSEPFLAHRNGRNIQAFQKLRRGGQTVRGTAWPWETLARGSPSSSSLCICKKVLPFPQLQTLIKGGRFLHGFLSHNNIKSGVPHPPGIRRWRAPLFYRERRREVGELCRIAFEVSG